MDFLPPFRCGFRILVPFDFGTDEAAAEPDASACTARNFFFPIIGAANASAIASSPSAARPASASAAGLVGQAGEPKLLPGCQERRAGSRLAEGASGLLEEHGPLPAPYLTRRLLGATACGTEQLAPNSSEPYLTRPLFDASASVCGAYLHVRRQYLTRRHRHQHPAAANQGTRHSGHGARNEPRKVIA